MLKVLWVTDSSNFYLHLSLKDTETLEAGLTKFSNDNYRNKGLEFSPCYAVCSVDNKKH